MTDYNKVWPYRLSPLVLLGNTSNISLIYEYDREKGLAFNYGRYS